MTEILKQIIDNTEAIANGHGEDELEKLLGEDGVKQYAQVVLTFAKHLTVASAYCIHKYNLQKGKSSDQIGAYQEALADLQSFFIRCAQIAAKKQPKGEKQS